MTAPRWGGVSRPNEYASERKASRNSALAKVARELKMQNDAKTCREQAGSCDTSLAQPVPDATQGSFRLGQTAADMLAQIVIDKLHRAANPQRHPDQPPAFPPPPTSEPADPRIGRANRVLWRCRINRETDCWEWQDAVSGKGYGRVKFGGRILLPHRVVAVAAGILTGASEDDDPRLILHGCDNRLCCNPAHMEAGTQSRNMKDCVARGRWRKRRE